MRPSASTEEVRTAYRALARRLHPDRQVDATAAERALAERRMREINAAWEVLQDPGRRRAYDHQQFGGARSGSGAGGAGRGPGGGGTRASGAGVGVEIDSADLDDDLVDVGPEVHGLAGAALRHLPWLVALAVLGVIFVFTAYAGSGGTTGVSPTTTPAVGPGTCVDVRIGPSTTVVPCSGPHELEIVVRVTETERCPDGTERRRLGTDGLLDCVVAA